MDNIKRLDSTKLLEQAVKTGDSLFVSSFRIIKEVCPKLPEEKKAELSVELAKVMIEDFKTGIITQRLELIAENIALLKED